MREQIEAVLKKYRVPQIDQTFDELQIEPKYEVTQEALVLTITCGFPIQLIETVLMASLREHLQQATNISQIDITLEQKIQAHVVQSNIQRHKVIKNIIAVGSGKGGVGKSTVAVNMALALHAAGAKVGLLDADIYGPSLPHMLGGSERPESIEQKYLKPVVRYGIQTISIGYVIDQDDTPMIWRGPMVTKALQQLLQDTLWEDLDYLIVDLPPGTGDIQLTLAQRIPVSGAVIVTTPQNIALLDANKGIRMFEKVQIPILGIVENMSTHICEQCGHEQAIFGSGGGQCTAERYQVPLLGQLPLDARIQQQIEVGKPTVLADANSTLAKTYQMIALRAVTHLSLRQRDYSARFPKIVVN